MFSGSPTVVWISDLIAGSSTGWPSCSMRRSITVAAGDCAVARL
jgi:hypothetical protein